jgi:carboxypeptidase C (cathepsin A)
VYLTGIVLISPVLNFQTLSFDSFNDLAYWLYLPTYTATAHFHKKLAPPLDGDLARTLEEVKAWASTEYVLALAEGDALPAAKRDQVAKRLAAYTGLSAEYIKRSNLRVPIFAFTKELLRDQERTVGRLDSRYKGIDRNQNGLSPEYDPSYAAIQGVYTAALNAYVRDELKFESDLNYEILTGNVRPWNFGGAQNRYADVAESLRSAMTQNPNLKVLACDGYYDLATPFFAMTYTINHMGLHDSVRGNISQAFYGSGHMMYVRRDDLAKLRDDAARFYAGDK